jgi:hypothetical protein
MNFKRTFLLPIAILFSLSIFAQAVPDAVMQTFKSTYPNSEIIEWENIEGNYTASFFNSRKQYSVAIFSPAGKWIETNTQIEESGLPSKVVKCWKKEYPEIRSVTAILKTEVPKKKPKYQISFETPTLLVNLLFNHKGKVKKKFEEPIATDN